LSFCPSGGFIEDLSPGAAQEGGKEQRLRKGGRAVDGVLAKNKADPARGQDRERLGGTQTRAYILGQVEAPKAGQGSLR
jgi:hypothetical protein